MQVFDRAVREVFTRAEVNRRSLGEAVDRVDWAALEARARQMLDALDEGRADLLGLSGPQRMRDARREFLFALQDYRDYAIAMRNGKQTILTKGLTVFDRRMKAILGRGVYHVTAALNELAIVEVELGLAKKEIFEPDVVTGTWSWWAIDSFGPY